MRLLECVMWAAGSFGTCNDPAGYADHVPGGQYLAEFFKNSARGMNLQRVFNRLMCGISSTNACADHCHKPSKRIRRNGERASTALFTVGTPAVQIMGQYAVRSKALAELAIPLAGMHSRLVKLQNTVVSTLSLAFLHHPVNHLCLHVPMASPYGPEHWI